MVLHVFIVVEMVGCGEPRSTGRSLGALSAACSWS